jgi:hypothetical protein
MTIIAWAAGFLTTVTRGHPNSPKPGDTPRILAHTRGVWRVYREQSA